MRMLLALLIAMATTIPAAFANYVSSESHSYKLFCNRNGYVLTSIHPVSRFIEGGAASRIENLAPEKLFLGKSCDTFHEVLGTGNWCWANGGFRATFGNQIIGFPRQELNCNNRSYDLPCRC